MVASPRAKKLASQMGVDLASCAAVAPTAASKRKTWKRPAVSRSLFPGSPREPPPLFPAAQPRRRRHPSAPAGSSFPAAPATLLPFNLSGGRSTGIWRRASLCRVSRVGYTITTDKLDAFSKLVKPKGVTMTALLAKAVAVTLARHPQVNAATTAAGMTYPSDVNVAIAVAMEDGGLITPVLRNADRTDLYEMSRQWKDLVKRSRSKQLQPEEYSTGTFTLSNLGMFGVDRFDAILPPGTGAILAVAASRPTVVAGKDGSIAVKRQMQVNLTADHRVIYGADGGPPSSRIWRS